jgi:hypothetical protein
MTVGAGFMSEGAGASRGGRKSKKVAAAEPQAAQSTYADGAPLDGITYLEAKLILKPERFIAAQSFRDFGKIVRKTAAQAGVGFAADPEFSRPPKIREIVFCDTPDFALYGSAFILRRRIAYEDGFAIGDPEIVFKFRHPDQPRAAALDVRPKIDGKYRIKFKAEILPLKDRVGGYRVLYSHNCEFGLSQTKDADQTAMSTLGRIFPALARLKPKGERVSLVNNGIVEEILLPIGVLDFGKGLTAKCDISLWRTRGEHRSLVGEFAFQAKFATAAALAAKQRQRMERFYIALQHAVEDWLALGVTKTAMVYRLNGAAPQSHE